MFRSGGLSDEQMAWSKEVCAVFIVLGYYTQRTAVHACFSLAKHHCELFKGEFCFPHYSSEMILRLFDCLLPKPPKVRCSLWVELPKNAMGGTEVIYLILI